MDHEQDVVRVKTRFERRRAPSIIVGGVVVFLLIALLKPWSFGDDGSADGRPGTPGSIAGASGLAIDPTPPPATPSRPVTSR